MRDVEELLESTDPLNSQESIDACVLALKQKKNELVRQWLGEPRKLACTEEMGDAIKPFDCDLALAVYIRAHVPRKVIQCYAETGQFDKIVQHSQTIGYQSEDYLFLLESILSSETAEQGLKLAKRLILLKHKKSGIPIVTTASIIDVFAKAGLIEACITILLDILKADNAADADLQTRLFELYFEHDVTAAKQLLNKKSFTHYDRKRIAQLCERHGDIRLAVELCQSMDDVLRILSKFEAASLIESDGEWLNAYLASLDDATAVKCLESMLKINSVNHDNRLAVANLAMKLFRDKLDSSAVVESLQPLNLDREMLKLCEDNGWKREQIQLLLQLKNSHLWSSFLTSGISTKEYFVAALMTVAKEVQSDSEIISCLIKSLMAAMLSSDLLVVLENMLFEAKMENRSMNNLLLLTAIKLTNGLSGSETRVMDYALRLEDYDGIVIAEMAASHDLFEEAFAIYKKFGDNKSAMKILVEKIGDMDRARKFAEQCNDPAIWALVPKEPRAQQQQQEAEHEIIIQPEASEKSPSPVTLEPSSVANSERPVTVFHRKSRESPKIPEIVLLDQLASPVPERPNVGRANSPVLTVRASPKLPPIKSAVNNTQAFKFAELATKVKFKQNARNVLQMSSDDIQKWLIEIGLEQYCDKFARYNGQMLDNLYSLHFSAPEFFCQSLSSKLGGELDDILLFFGALCQLYGDR